MRLSVVRAIVQISKREFSFIPTILYRKKRAGARNSYFKDSQYFVPPAFHFAICACPDGEVAVEYTKHFR
jgi:hypothetical protein